MSNLEAAKKLNLLFDSFLLYHLTHFIRMYGE